MAYVSNLGKNPNNKNPRKEHSITEEEFRTELERVMREVDESEREVLIALGRLWINMTKIAIH